MKLSDNVIEILTVAAAICSAIAAFCSYFSARKANVISLRQVELQKSEHQPMFRINQQY